MYMYTHTQRHTQWNVTQILKEEILPFATKHMSFESVMLGKVSQRKTYDLTYMGSIRKTELRNSRLVIARGENVGEMGEGSQKVQTSSYKMS